MTIKIGTVEFTVEPINADPKLDGIKEYMWHQNKGWVPVYRWNCNNPPPGPKEGVFTLLMDCVVSFAVLKKPGSDKLSKKKSARMADSFVQLTGLKKKKLVEAVRKAIGPLKIEMDARPSIQKWGRAYSFDVEMVVMSTYFALRPKGNPGFGTIIVGIPFMHAFMLKKTGTCKGAHMLREPMDKWFGAVGKTETHDAWYKEHYKHERAAEKRWREGVRKRNAKKGIKMPKED